MVISVWPSLTDDWQIWIGKCYHTCPSSAISNLMSSPLSCPTLLWQGSRLLTKVTGLPAQRVFSGSLLPAGTQELGATTTLHLNHVYPRSICAPSMITVLKPILASSSMIALVMLQECSMLTLFPIVVDKGKASSGTQKADWIVELSPTLVLVPIRTGLQRPSTTAPKPTQELRAIETLPQTVAFGAT